MEDTAMCKISTDVSGLSSSMLRTTGTGSLIASEPASALQFSIHTAPAIDETEPRADIEDEEIAELTRFIVAARWRDQKDRVDEKLRLGIHSMQPEEDQRRALL
jgi:hypothetical protein